LGGDPDSARQPAVSDGEVLSQTARRARKHVV